MAIVLNNLPDSGRLNDERDKFQQLFNKGSILVGTKRTTTGQEQFTSQSSGGNIVYDTTGTTYDNQGEEGLMLLLLNGDTGSGYNDPLKDYLIEAETINDLNFPKYSAITTANNRIQDYPAGTLEGKILGIKKGQSIYQSIKNGDFSSGTTGWSASTSVLSESGQVLSITGNGGSAVAQALKENSFSTGVNDEFFIYSRARVTNNDAQLMFMFLRDGNNVAGSSSVAINNPNQNQWYELYTETTLSNAGLGDLRLYHQYADSATANGKVMEVDGNAGVFVINKTAQGLESLTETQLVEMARASYWEGFQNSKFDFTSEGKNLFDGFLERGGYNSVTGVQQSEVPTEDYARNKNQFIQIESSTLYTLTPSVSLEQNRFYEYDAQFNFLGIVTTSFSVTTSSKTKYINFRVFNTSGVDLDTLFILEKGSATDYIPYQKSESSYDIELRSVPAIADKIYNAVQDGTELKATAKPAHEKNVSDLTAIGNGVTVNTTNYPLAKLNGSFFLAQDNGTLVAGVVDGSTTTTDSGDFIYQLATPIITELETDELYSYPDGRLIDNSNIISDFDYVTPVNTAARIQGNAETSRNTNENQSTLRVDIDANTAIINTLIAKDSGIVSYNESLAGSSTVIKSIVLDDSIYTHAKLVIVNGDYGIKIDLTPNHVFINGIVAVIGGGAWTKAEIGNLITQAVTDVTNAKGGRVVSGRIDMRINDIAISGSNLNITFENRDVSPHNIICNVYWEVSTA